MKFKSNKELQQYILSEQSRIEEESFTRDVLVDFYNFLTEIIETMPNSKNVLYQNIEYRPSPHISDGKYFYDKTLGKELVTTDSFENIAQRSVLVGVRRERATGKETYIMARSKDGLDNFIILANDAYFKRNIKKASPRYSAQAGAGTKRTEDQENLFIVLLSYLYEHGDLDSGVEDIEPEVNKLRSVTYTTNTLKKTEINNSVKYLLQRGNKKVFFKGMLKQAYKIKRMLNKKPTNIEKDSPKLEINKTFSKLKPKGLVPDKWNPADIWIVYDYPDFSKFDSLHKLNIYLGDSINTRTGIVGVSLKSPTKSNPKLNVVNIKRAKGQQRKENIIDVKYVLTPIGTKTSYIEFKTYKGKNIKVEVSNYGGKKISFQVGKITIPQESWESVSRHGRASLNFINTVFKNQIKIGKEYNKNIFEIKDKKLVFTSAGENLYKKARKSFNSLKNKKRSLIDIKSPKKRGGQTKALMDDQEKFLNFANGIYRQKGVGLGTVNIIFSSKFQTMELFDFLSKNYIQNKKEIDTALDEFLNFAMSKSEISAPHIKLEQKKV